MPLASYRDKQAREWITVADFIDYHNQRYIRTPLAPFAFDLLREVRAMVVARQDCVDAQAAGIDRQPKYLQDRANFRNYLALDLYEKECLRPK